MCARADFDNQVFMRLGVLAGGLGRCPMIVCGFQFGDLDGPMMVGRSKGLGAAASTPLGLGVFGDCGPGVGNAGLLGN